MKRKLSAFIVVCILFSGVQAFASRDQEVGLREQGWTSFTAGKYAYAEQGFDGELTLESIRVGVYTLITETYRVDNYNLCGFEGDCTENEDGLLCINADAPEVKVTVKAVPDGLYVDGGDITYFCGHRGTFKGKYVAK